jgi:hypothetical protein
VIPELGPSDEVDTLAIAVEDTAEELGGFEPIDPSAFGDHQPGWPQIRVKESAVDPRDASFGPKAIREGRIAGLGIGTEIDDLSVAKALAATIRQAQRRTCGAVIPAGRSAVDVKASARIAHACGA